MSLLEFTEAAARGGAIAICIVLTVQLVLLRPWTGTHLFGALFLIGAGLYTLVSMPQVGAALGPALVPLKTVAVTAPAFFWLFVLSTLDDEFRWRRWMAGPPLAAAILYLSCLPFPAFQDTSRLLELALSLGLMAHVMVRLKLALANDLVVSRWRFTRTLVMLVPVIALAICIIATLEGLRIQADWTRVGVAAMTLGINITLALTLSRLRGSLVQRVPFSPQNALPSEGLSAADRIDLGRLRDLMEEGAYLTDGLTIGALAGRLNLPEHRLRKLINRGLGYRNFAAFLNDYRIAEARRRLAEPALVHTQITQLAFELGYGSLAPFNRAFRERVGMSPSEFRAHALDGA